MFFGGGAAGKAGKVSQVAGVVDDLGRVANVADDASRLGRVSGAVDDLGRLGGAVDDLGRVGRGTGMLDNLGGLLQRGKQAAGGMFDNVGGLLQRGRQTVGGVFDNIVGLPQQFRQWSGNTFQAALQRGQGIFGNMSEATQKLWQKALGKADDGTPAPRIASGVSEDPLEFSLIQRGRQDINPRHQDFLDRLASQDSMGAGLTEVAAREVTATDLAVLTEYTGLEHALVMLDDGKRVLAQMDSYKGGNLPADTKTLLMHSHPNDGGSGLARFISAEDVDALNALNQRYSYMVTVDGSVYRFTQETMPNTVGEMVRTLDYSGWTQPKP
jgi:hypothetical protein